MRVSPRPLRMYPWYLRPFFWRQRRKYGAILDSALLCARSPRLFLGVALLYWMIDRKSSPIDPALHSLVTVRVSQINGCVDDALVAQIRTHFNDDAIVDLTGLNAFQNMSSKFNSALGVSPQGFCRIPEN